MKMTNEYEFISEDFKNFSNKIRKESITLIEKMIKDHSVIQIGEDVEIENYKQENSFIRVISVELMAISSWGDAGEKLSFRYEGIPLAKNGKPMLKRKPVWFGTFFKDGTKYHCPSYSRVKIIPAKLSKSE